MGADTYIKQEDTAAWKLFNLRFPVRIPEKALHCKKSLDLGLLKTTGDSETDQVILDRSRRVHLCTAGIAEHFSRGTDVRVDSYSIMGEMYYIIKEHLLDWCGILENDMNVIAPPVEDFYILDDFARHLHSFKMMFSNKEVRSNLFLRNFKSQKGYVMGLLGTKTPVKHKDTIRTREEYISPIERIVEILDTRGLL